MSEGIREINEEHRPRKRGAGLPDFNFQNLLILVLLLVIAGFAVYSFKPDLFKGKKTSVKQEQKKEAKTSGYSAVFLTNNQVYFGKLEGMDGNNPKLKDVYYLRVDQAKAATSSANSNISLVKLGGELHGPSDEITFNRDQILFVEELKTDGRVFKAIEDYKKKNP